MENIETEPNDLSKKNGDLAYQRQLFKVIQTMVDFREELLIEAAILANNGKPTERASIKFIDKKISETGNEKVAILRRLLEEIAQPIEELEKGLELKNDFLERIGK